MARDFSSRNNTLKNIAQKSNMSDTLVLELNIDDIIENPDNEKIFNMDGIEHLAQGIEEKGFNGAIEVFKLDNGKYEICSGHRRFRAMKQLGKKTIKAIVSENVNDVEKAERLLDGNIFNRKLSPLDMGRAIKYYKENVLKQKEFKGDVRKAVAYKFNISESQVYKYEALLNLIPEVQEKVAENVIAFSAVTSMTNLDESLQLEINKRFDKFIEQNGENSLTRDIVQKIIKMASIKSEEVEEAIEVPKANIANTVITNEHEDEKEIENEVEEEHEDEKEIENEVEEEHEDEKEIENEVEGEHEDERRIEDEIEEEYEDEKEIENEITEDDKVEIKTNDDIELKSSISNEAGEQEEVKNYEDNKFNIAYTNMVNMLNKEVEYEDKKSILDKLKLLESLIEKEVERLK